MMRVSIAALAPLPGALAFIQPKRYTFTSWRLHSAGKAPVDVIDAVVEANEQVDISDVFLGSGPPAPDLVFIEQQAELISVFNPAVGPLIDSVGSSHVLVVPDLPSPMLEPTAVSVVDLDPPMPGAPMETTDSVGIFDPVIEVNDPFAVSDESVVAKITAEPAMPDIQSIEQQAEQVSVSSLAYEPVTASVPDESVVAKVDSAAAFPDIQPVEQQAELVSVTTPAFEPGTVSIPDGSIMAKVTAESAMPDIQPIEQQAEQVSISSPAYEPGTVSAPDESIVAKVDLGPVVPDIQPVEQQAELISVSSSTAFEPGTNSIPDESVVARVTEESAMPDIHPVEQQAELVSASSPAYESGTVSVPDESVVANFDAGSAVPEVQLAEQQAELMSVSSPAYESATFSLPDESIMAKVTAESATPDIHPVEQQAELVSVLTPSFEPGTVSIEPTPLPAVPDLPSSIIELPAEPVTVPVADFSPSVPEMPTEMIDAMKSALAEKTSPMFETLKISALSTQDAANEKVPTMIGWVQIHAKDAAETATAAVKANAPILADLVKTSATSVKEAVATNAPPVLESVKSSAISAKGIAAVNAPSVMETMKSTAMLTKEAVITSAPVMIESVKTTAVSAKAATESARASGVFNSVDGFLQYAKKGVETAATSPENLNRLSSAKEKMISAAISSIDKVKVVAQPVLESSKSSIKSSLTHVIETQQMEAASQDMVNAKCVTAKIATVAAMSGTAIVDFDYGGLVENLDLENNGSWYLLLLTIVWGLGQREAGRKSAQLEFQSKLLEAQAREVEGSKPNGSLRSVSGGSMSSPIDGVIWS